MKIVDLNILLYAVSPSFKEHPSIRAWWENAMGGDEPVGLSWIVLTGFVRIATNPRIFPRPMATEVALDKVEVWLRHPNTQLIQEAGSHWNILRELLELTGSAGNLTTDAHLAALTISHGAQLVSCDNDFARFTNLRWINPLQKRA